MSQVTASNWKIVQPAVLLMLTADERQPEETVKLPSA